MFNIYIQKVEDRRFDRYYQNWDNAKKQMEEDISAIVKRGAKLIREDDYFNSSKGFYVYEQEYLLKGAKYKYSIIDGYFSD